MTGEGVNVRQFIEMHKHWPLWIFLAHARDQRDSEPTMLGKAFWAAVLEFAG